MKSQLVSTQATLPTGTQTRQDLFIKFSGMLFGYILEVVKSTQVAEQYLTDVFNQLTFSDIDAITRPGVNTFCQLQMMARKMLATFTAAINDCADNAKPADITINGNKFIALMPPDQQQVFCGIHYHGKTAAMLAAELNQTEATIRQLLKESFTIIRKTRNDTAAIH